MFDIGFWEVSLLAVIGLIVLGPERLPVVARTLGGLVGRAKAYVRGLTSEIEREISVDDLRAEVRRAREQIESSTRDTIESVRTLSHEPDSPSPKPSIARGEAAPDRQGADESPHDDAALPGAAERRQAPADDRPRGGDERE